MSGTRAKTIRANIISAIEAATLDTRVGVFDRFKHLALARRPESARERSFRCNLSSSPARDTLQTQDAYVVEYQVEIYYALAPDIEERVADDFERFWWALETLQSRNASINICEPNAFGIEETPSMYVARLTVVVRYRLDSSVLS